MRTAIDTNVLSTLWSEAPGNGSVAGLLHRAHLEGSLVICGAVYAELFAYPGMSEDVLRAFLLDTGVQVDFDLGDNVWRTTGAAYAQYAQRRRRSGGGEPKRLLVDFVIGAHALVAADRLMTLDPDRYRSAYPTLVLIL